MRATICGGLGIVALALASTASATLVTWEFNPNNQNGSVGSASRTYNVSGFSLTAYGFNRVSGPDTAHTLFYKNEAPVGGAGERGLGLVGTTANELNINGDGSIPHYIQFDLTSIIDLGFINGQIAVASLQQGEGFQIYGSNTLGSLGTQLGGTFTGLSFDGQFVDVPDFGDYNYISIAAASGRVLPFGFRASFNPIPEIGGFSAMIVLAGFVGLLIVSRAIRARRLS
jgi:hypothetical protein